MGSPKDPIKRLEWIRNKSISMKGKNKGKPGPRTGHTKENDESVRIAAKKISISHIGKTGENACNYKDGRSIKWEEVRNQALERDDYQCQGFRTDPDHICKGKIDVHHIQSRKERPDLILDINNLITFCSSFHGECDSTGRKHTIDSKEKESISKKNFYQTEEGKESKRKEWETRYQNQLEKLGVYKLRKFLYGYENRISLY